MHVVTYDVREIANLVIDIAQGKNKTISNLTINKIVFFLHEKYLIEEGKPLVSAKIEAWKFGPVFRELYNEFKVFAEKPITVKAKRFNPLNARLEVCALDSGEQIGNNISGWCESLLELTPYQLVELSHAEGGAWDRTFNHGKGSNPGMEITNQSILTAHQGQFTQ